MSDTRLIPYGRQVIDDDDVRAVAQVLRGEFLTTGPAVGAFERALGSVVDAPEVVACSSGTAALHLAALALRLGPGDAAIVPAITFSATANAVRYVGAEVVFADVDPDTGLMGPIELEAAIAGAGDKRLRAVFPVHLAGQCAEPGAMAAIARRHGLAIVEDASHALGTTYSRAGARTRIGAALDSDIVVFSFHPVKTIAMGEGGALTTRSPAHAEALRRFRTHGITRDPSHFLRTDLAIDANGAPNPWYYELEELGYNYRASDILCALGASQLTKLNSFVARRTRLVARYDELLRPLAPIVRPLERVPDVQPGWHLYVLLIDFSALGRDRAAVMKALAARGVGTQVHYIPVPELGYYRKRYGASTLPGAARYYARALSIPLHAAMSDDDQDRIISVLFEVLGGA